MTLFILLMFSGSDILVIFGIVILLFGGTKIPQLMKGLGEGIKEFKKASKDDANDAHPEKPMPEGK